MVECVFCGIAKGAIPSKKVYEDNSVIAVLDINPRNPGHTLVVPKKHYETIMEMPDNEAQTLFAAVKKMASVIKKATNADGVSISQSNGRAAGQIIPHVHFHVIPRFMNEGPVGLESILPSKRLDEQTMNKLVESIKTSMTTTPSSSVSANTEDGSKEKKSEKKEKTKEEDVLYSEDDVFDF